MNKEYIISKNKEILTIIKSGKKIFDNFFTIYNIESKNDFSRYCISVNKKFGNAVERNKIKRQIKHILSTNSIKNNYNYVIIVKPVVKDLSYWDIRKKILDLIGCE